MISTEDEVNEEEVHPYHHGDLRNALVEGTLDMLNTCAAQEITFSKLAKSIGVSQPAPYRHFKNRVELLETIAASGFMKLLEDMRASVARAPEHGFVSASRAYVQFGTANFNLYRLMFSTEILEQPCAQVKAAADAAYSFLTDYVQNSLASSAPDVTSALIWSTLHGLVELSSSHLLTAQKMSADTLIMRLLELLKVPAVKKRA